MEEMGIARHTYTSCTVSSTLFSAIKAKQRCIYPGKSWKEEDGQIDDGVCGSLIGAAAYRGKAPH
jgi:hypothetical protein